MRTGEPAIWRSAAQRAPRFCGLLGFSKGWDSQNRIIVIQSCLLEVAMGVLDRLILNDEAWARIAPHIIGDQRTRGSSGRDNRLFVEAVLWIVRTGAPWRDLPERFGNWNSVFQRFNRWAKSGVWQRVFETLRDPDLESLMLDSTTIRAHQHAAGAVGNKRTTRKPWADPVAD